MGGTDQFDLLPLFRQGARRLLEIPEEATEADVRRRCLEHLEEADFAPDDDVSAAIQILCGESLRAAAMPRHAPELGRRIEFLVRGKLEQIAARLRQRLSEPDSPGEQVPPEDARAAELPITAALEVFRGAAELFPATELWHRRLGALSRMTLPRRSLDRDQMRIVAALLESATTWPGNARQVRRAHLAALTPHFRFSGAARALREGWPDAAALDPLFLGVLTGAEAQEPALEFLASAWRSSPSPPAPPGFSWRRAARKFLRLIERSPFLWTILFALVLVGIPVSVDSLSRPHPPASNDDPFAIYRSVAPKERAVSTEIDPMGLMVYAPRRLPAVAGVAPGEAVSTLFLEGKQPVLITERRRMYHVPKGDFVPLSRALSDLRKRTERFPGDALGWVARGNFDLLRGEEGAARECFERAERLGALWTLKRVDGRSLRIPIAFSPESPAAEPDVPPPPPLPIPLEREAR